VTDPSSIEVGIVTAVDGAAMDSKLDEEDDGNDDTVVTDVDFTADNFNPYPSIVEGTADDEQYKCEEPEIVKIEAMGRINVVAYTCIKPSELKESIK
jgi:hypothetical protein